MTVEAILLLVLAAVVHSAWNLLSKRSLDKQVFLWAAMLTSLLLLAFPCGYLVANLQAPITPLGWLCVALSGTLEAIYILLLGSSYQRGDLSLVYPLARGSAVLFVTCLAVPLLNEMPSALGLAGIMLVVLGIYTLHLK